MKNKKKNTFLILIATVPLLLIAVNYIESYIPWTIPQTIVGTWTSSQKITVRYNHGSKYQFKTSPGPVVLKLKIYPDGRVSGMLGNAFLKGCSVIKNRGWITKLVNFSTDFTINGQIAGQIFPEDTIALKEIRLPISKRTANSINATIFQSKGMEIFPMADLYMVKNMQDEPVIKPE